MFKEKIHNLINFISGHKKVFALILGIGLFLPFFAFAIDFSGLFTGLISWALKLPLMITRGAAHLAITLFRYVTDPNFTNLSYTNPATNPVIKLGLEITRPFANLAIVFFLIVIGLSIALNYKKYGSQKLLVKLVAIALLVNFVPLALGAVIDAANIVTFYFFENIGEGPTMIQNKIAGMGGDNIIPPDEGRGFGATQIYGILTAIAFNALIAWTFFIYAFISYFVMFISGL